MMPYPELRVDIWIPETTALPNDLNFSWFLGQIVVMEIFSFCLKTSCRSLTAGENNSTMIPFCAMNFVKILRKCIVIFPSDFRT
jgi:hypothetical protein